MKFSENWLREWVNPSLSSAELDEQLSLAGLEVDSRTPVAGEFNGVVVGEILSAEQHPNADKLRVCQVSNGQETVQVICGAPNARAGIKVAFAQVGALLPGNFKIKKAKLRGEESHGMLCSEQELEMSDSHEGIMELAADAPLGVDVREFLQLNDQVFDVDLTPNRSDCLSIAGLAREVSALNKIAINKPQINPVAATHTQELTIHLDAPAACPRYLGRIIKNVNIQAVTPLWMQEKLQRSGLRSLDPVVDVTNFVMLELGQPLHAFDLANIKDCIHVRQAQDNEELTLLDDSKIKLNSSNLVIADAEKALALAGIMGGENSGCSATTQDIFLEVAYFDPLLLAGKARELGLHTDASHRFERGVDFNLQEEAMHRATELLLAIVGGEAGPITHAQAAEHLPKLEPITLRKQRLAQLLAIELEPQLVTDLLTSLGLQVEDQGAAWLATIPSHRFDLKIEEDLIEEVARIYGYDNLPVSAPTAQLVMQGQPEAQVRMSNLRASLQALGYQEVITYSFIDPKWSQAFDPNTQPLALANPLSSELAVMRTSLLPGLAKVLSYNQKRQKPRVRIFESGLSFVPQADGNLVQEVQLAGLISGNRNPEGWNTDATEVDFFDLKGDLESLFSLAKLECKFVAAQHPALHPGQCAEVFCLDAEQNWVSAGWLGALHPQLTKQLGIKGKALVFEVQLNLLTQGNLPNFKPVSRFPEMRRDLALVVNAELIVGDLLATARQEAGEWLQNLTLFDVYQGKGIEEGKKSLALGLTWQHPSRTLTDEEVNSQVDQVVTALQQNFNAELRS